MKKVYQHIIKNKSKKSKQLAVLIDPDKCKSVQQLKAFILNCEKAKVDFIFVGGSLLIHAEFEKVIVEIKKNTSIPIVIFPGSPLQISSEADAILFLSLISGRNAELLIGHQVTAAPYLKKSGLEVIPTGYILVDCGNSTTSSYMSQSLPVPYDKGEIAAVTALAGEMLGLKMIYVDGGSGAKKNISSQMVQQIVGSISIPLIVGGGINSLKTANELWKSGADLVVIGTLFEKKPNEILKFSKR